jgi:hypothetical protein
VLVKTSNNNLNKCQFDSDLAETSIQVTFHNLTSNFMKEDKKIILFLTKTISQLRNALIND